MVPMLEEVVSWKVGIPASSLDQFAAVSRKAADFVWRCTY
jgi:hypothetical protein